MVAHVTCLRCDANAHVVQTPVEPRNVVSRGYTANQVGRLALLFPTTSRERRPLVQLVVGNNCRWRSRRAPTTLVYGERVISISRASGNRPAARTPLPRRRWSTRQTQPSAPMRSAGPGGR